VVKSPEWGKEYGVRFTCEEGYHNDAATLFMSSNHHTITHLFSMGHSPGQPFQPFFSKGSLALYLVFYHICMSIGAGVAIPGGLFMPSILVSSVFSLFTMP
jgi:chloride channel 7